MSSFVPPINTEKEIAFFKENLRLNYAEPLNRGLLTIRVDIMFHCFVCVDSF